MSEEATPYTVTNNTRNKQFEIMAEDDKAELVYRFRENTMFFMHTKVPDALRGKGIASLLVSTALEFAKANDHRIAILCPFTSKYIKKHPEWYALYDTSYHRIPLEHRKGQE